MTSAELTAAADYLDAQARELLAQAKAAIVAGMDPSSISGDLSRARWLLELSDLVRALAGRTAP